MIQVQAIQELDAALNTVMRTASTRRWVNEAVAEIADDAVRHADRWREVSSHDPAFVGDAPSR